MIENFWNTLIRELNKLVSGKKHASDIVNRFYMLADEIPQNHNIMLRNAFEDFHYHAANYEQNEDIRKSEAGLIGENELKNYARHFISVIEKNLANPN